MSIQPIDLQTLFVKMNQVGKEQAVNKESITLQQELQGSEIVKKNQHDDNSVNRTDSSDSGPEKTKEDGEGEKNQSQREHKKGKDGKQNNHEILFDPDLGRNIDISG